jgi:HK97 family phage major capsid protein
MKAPTALARALAACMRCKGDVQTAHAMSSAQWGESDPATVLLRAAVTTDSIGDADSFGDLIAAAPTRSILAAIDAVSPFRRSEPGVPVLVSTTSPKAAWRREAQPIAVTATDFTTVTLSADRGLGSIVVFTVESSRMLGDTFTRQLGADVSTAINSAEGGAMFDPNNSGDGDAPASITYNAIAVQSSGTTADALRADLASLIARFGGDFGRAVLVCAPSTAARLALYGAALGAADISTAGGYLAGLPVCVAPGIPPDLIALIDPSGIVLFDGGAAFSASEQANVTLNDGRIITLWAENYSGLRFTRVLDWAIGRPGAVAAVVNIDWPAAP